MLLENNSYPLDVRVRMEAEALARVGYEVTVCAQREPGQPRHELVEGVRVHRWRLPRTPASVAGFLLEYLVANLQLHWAGVRELVRGAQVLHLHNPPDTLFPIAYIARAAGRRVIFDHHDLAPELLAEKFGDGPLVRLLRIFERLTFRVAHIVISTNESHRQVALDRGRRSPTDVVVVRNGPPRATLGASHAPRGGSLKDPHLIFLGSMESQDGVDVLPELLVRLARDHDAPDAHLTLVGTGSRLEPLKQTAIAAGVADRVTFTGQVPHADVPWLLAQADICLDPAPCTELNHHSTMIKIAEYMAAGRPIVAYPLRETRRTAGDIVSFAGCDDPGSFAARVAELTHDGAQRQRRGEAGAARAVDLVWERQEEQLLAAYGRLAGARARVN